MSNLKFSYKLSRQLLHDLRALTDEDLAWQNMKPIASLENAYRFMCGLYIKYILLTNSFVKLINMTVTYHKRERLKPIVSNLLGRIVELKAEMVKLMKADFPYLDQLLMDMELSRRDIELEIPDYYRMERSFVVKEFFRFTEKIKDGLVLRPFPKKPVPELALDLKKYYLADIKARKLIQGEEEGRRIEHMRAEEAQRALNRARGLPERLQSPFKRPPQFTPPYTGRGEIKKVIQMMGIKREKVYEAMKTLMKQPLNERYESWKFPFARDIVRAPYFQGKKYFHGYNKLVDPFEYGKFVTAIAILQKHERARTGGIYYMIMKERHEKIFMILMNRRKGLKTVLKTKEDFVYPIVFRDHHAIRRKTILEGPFKMKQINLMLQVYGLLPVTAKNTDFCEKYQKYKSHMRKMIQHEYEEIIEAEAHGEEEFSQNTNQKEMDLIEEILEYFRAWHQESKQHVLKYGWDLMDIPNPDKKGLPPPNFVVGIPKVLTDEYIKANFDEIVNIPQRPPPLSGTAYVVSGNHITKEQYQAVKPLGLARQAMPKEAREAEDKKRKEQKEKQKEQKEKSQQKKGKEEEGYKPQKSQIPLFVMQRSHDVEMANDYEENEIHPMIAPRLFHEEDVNWRIANTVHLQLREGVDRRMIALQKEVRQKMAKKHRKAENLKKKNPPGMKKPKKEWALSDQEKWDIVFALAKDGYFRNYRNNVLSHMPGTNQFAYSNAEWIEEYLTEPEPAWGDLYQLVKLWCVLPLADMTVRQYGPVVSAVGFAGPREVINRLVCSVAHEAGAVLIHIDPQRPEGEIPVSQLAGMITKIAKSAQPTIILVDNCHLMYRKKEKGVPIEPSPYTKLVSRLKKGINRKFRILMIGATDKPELVNGGKMGKVFDKIIPFPYKDYHTSADYWGKYLFKNETLSSSFPYPALVEPTKVYKTPDLTRLFSNVTMTPERKKDLVHSHLKIAEFEEPLRAAKMLETTSDTIKMPISAYAWASSTYKSFKGRKKMLKELLDERLGKLQEAKDKKKK
ncbi:hypothetical protein GE061_004141 [Apolygus lucorum]|uniref:ATPase AAA-type core domain-containing protein n=1 Tax=Apolygus lucorum TaxID=248454 RepID=A0A8S9X104_APOLU|nr:hypothetical protein GE061_004141 [Apolygus lucorum]